MKTTEKTLISQQDCDGFTISKYAISDNSNLSRTTAKFKGFEFRITKDNVFYFAF